MRLYLLATTALAGAVVLRAATRRRVGPFGQHVHSFLELVPVMAAAFVCMLHSPQVRALLGLGRDPPRPDWSLRRKRQKLPTRYVAGMLGTQVALEWAPYLEEMARTLRARRHTLAPSA